MLPEERDPRDLRAVIHKTWILRNATRVPLSYYKNYLFQIKEQSSIKSDGSLWEKYCLETKRITGST